VMPIPCVDLLIRDERGRVLLVLRRNEPAAGQWWFPGGRVLFGELRREAAMRKLKEECGLSSTQFQERGTFDVILDVGPNRRVHAITTVFKTEGVSACNVQLDQQSRRVCWRDPRRWLERELHPFVYGQIEDCINL
jgi:ADP-ribose pyrophosphatase YjhB (NUDIX family)